MYSNETRNKSSNFDKTFNSQTNSLKKDASLNSDIDEATHGSLDDVEIEKGYTLQQLVAITAANYTEETLSTVGHQREHMIKSCSWMGLKCNKG